ncbi:hypothetical protein ACFL9S_07590 [Erwinia sp. AnSW2-5]|uniref:hypothetical protein n=1 Tax=Erwinia sp. AnSW2-5 TaxID=3367692 RepID=UPI00385A8592
MRKQTNSFTLHAPLRVIAITGCDGSGKSTLASSLVAHLSLRQPTELLYLGQSSGRIGEWISGLPVIGAPIGRYLRAKARQVNQHSSAAPGAITALVIYLLSCWRAYKFKRMLTRSEQGYLLVTDRYPQAEVAGFRFDGPQLATTVGGSGWVCTLRKREKRMYQWMASYPPMLLIRLDIDADTAHLRKPDHPLSALREKIEVIPHLDFNGANICDLNARHPTDKVFTASLCAINACFSLAHSQLCD